MIFKFQGQAFDGRPDSGRGRARVGRATRADLSGKYKLLISSVKGGTSSGREGLPSLQILIGRFKAARGFCFLSFHAYSLGRGLIVH